jgi:hypothetical protein
MVELEINWTGEARFYNEKMNEKKEKLKIIVKLNEKKWIDFMYVFLFFISFLYAGLLWANDYSIKSILNYKVPTQKPNYDVELKMKIDKMTEGHPIHEMSKYISQQDPKIASYLVAIAKKESNWGRYSPKKEGQDCYNYWGFRKNFNKTLSGYACFSSKKEAVSMVGSRIGELIGQDIETPSEMVVWKCGRSCSEHSPSSVKKWIADVSYYYKKISE